MVDKHGVGRRPASGTMASVSDIWQDRVPQPWQVAPLTREHANDICTWRYPEPYDVYDMSGADPHGLARGGRGFYALLRAGELVGFRCFGADGRVPGWAYDDAALDTGGGLRPELVGRGLGRVAVAAGLAFGRARFAPAAFRVTVATFSARALHTVEVLGFERVGRFDATHGGCNFEVLLRRETDDRPAPEKDAGRS